MKVNDENMTMDSLMEEIKETTKKQKSASRVDEVRVMRTMLNDPNYSISIYDKNKGYIGTRCPRQEAVKFAANISSAITGLDNKSATELANMYEFTKKDALFMIENHRDFTQTYLSTGRKLPIIQSEDAEAAVFFKELGEREKSVPDGNGNNKNSVIPAYTKVVCRSKSPKYHTNNNQE